MNRNQSRRSLRAIPQTTLRRLRNTPTYFFIIWRWCTWLYALLWIVATHTNVQLLLIPLGITLVQTLVVTLYTPVFQIFLPKLPVLNRLRLLFSSRQKPQLSTRQRGILHNRRQRPLAADEEAEILTPFARTRNPYKDLIIYGLDLLICGLVVYYTAPYWTPPFGSSSPFYRYGLSTVLVAAFAYRYRGGLLAALGYELLILLGAFILPFAPIHPYVLQIQDIEGSLIDAPLVAIIAAYLATMLNNYTRSKRHEQDSGRKQKALLRVGETLVSGAIDRKRLLQESAEQMRKGGHFERLIIALVVYTVDEADANGHSPQPEIDYYIEAGVVETVSIPSQESEASLAQVLQSREKLATFELLDDEAQMDTHRNAHLYLPFSKEGQLSFVLGAESRRETPFEKKHEEFLRIVGTQLLVALENLRLTEQASELAALAERGRIAREIHDGVAQLVYMLSLNTETCAALARRLAEASVEEEQMLPSLTERLDKLVTISKQALWETRHYMFTLKPLISGTSTLSQMLTNQLHEFEVISGLPAQLQVEGCEELPNGDQRRTRKIAQVGTALFRITQEALTNAYKHAEATQMRVYLRHLPRCVEVEICDNGKGLPVTTYSYDLSSHGERQRIYSGHGMRGMRERAEELGGTFEIRPLSAGGVSVRASIPI